jgi:Domain of unknown function DUF29
MPGTARELYEADFYAWTRLQADALRRLKELRLNAVELDLDHVAEEIEDLGSAVRSSVRSQVRRVLEHFLKLAFSPAQGPRRSWRRSILDARTELGNDLTPTLRRDVRARLPRLYVEARRAAVLGLEDYAEEEAARLLPEASPWTLDDVLRDDWYPEPVAPLPPTPP